MVATIGWIILGSQLAHGAAHPPARGLAGVATDHDIVSACGAEILAIGGNAVDAAVSSALCAGVVQPAGSGLGGGGFAVIRDANGIFVYDYREVAPSSATREMYVEGPGVPERASTRGVQAVAVPSEARGLAALLNLHGTLSPRAVAAPAISLASGGFVVEGHLAAALAKTWSEPVQDEFQARGKLALEGQYVRRPELAAAIKRWAKTKGESFHTGPDAQAISDATNGLVSVDDLAAVQVKEREPIVLQYGEYTIQTMPLPSSGGIVLSQMLAVLEGYDLKRLGHNSSDYLHLLTETMKHAYADRANFMGDPDFVDVPVARLLSAERVQSIRSAFDPARTLDPSAYGEMIEPPKDAGTQHISVIDADGNAVALTTTINTSFGSGIVASNGVILNNEMDDFAAAPGVPNAFGLIGNEANAIEPGKRPLSSMSPTFVMDGDGRVVLAVGASGGSTIISSVLQTILNVVVWDMDPQAAVTASRIHHQWMPDMLFVEATMARDVRLALEARGHVLKEWVPFSSVQAVQVTDYHVEAGSDPRKGGWPATVGVPASAPAE